MDKNGAAWRNPAVLCACLLSALWVTPSAAIYVDVPQHVFVGVDPAGGTRPLLDQLAPGPLTLDPGLPGGFNYAPASNRAGGAACAYRQNFTAAATVCGFNDNLFLPGLGWHGEFIVHNPNAFPLVFNAAFHDGWGHVYAGRAGLGAGSSLYVDLHLPDISYLITGADVGGPIFQWAFWRDPVLSRAINISFSTVEDIALAAPPTVSCPGSFGPIAHPQGSFECLFTHFSSPDDFWVAGAFDPTLASFSTSDPDAMRNFPDLFPQLVVPEPGSLALAALALGIFALSLARRKN